MTDSSPTAAEIFNAARPRNWGMTSANLTLLLASLFGSAKHSGRDRFAEEIQASMRRKPRRHQM